MHGIVYLFDDIPDFKLVYTIWIVQISCKDACGGATCHVEHLYFSEYGCFHYFFYVS